MDSCWGFLGEIRDVQDAVKEHLPEDCNPAIVESLQFQYEELDIDEYLERLQEETEELDCEPGYLNDYSLGVEGMSHEELIDKLYTEMAEFSFLTPYLFANDVEEININSWKDVKITYADGRVVPTKERFQTPQHAVDVIRRLLHKSGMILDML